MGSLIPDSKQLNEILYESALTTAGAIAVAFAVQKAFGKRLGVSMTMEGALMLAAAIAGGTVIVNYLQAEKYLPEELGN